MITFGLAVFVLIAVLWFLGWYAKRWVVTEADYLLAGRQVGLVAGVAGVCGIAFAGSMTSIVPGLTIQYGFMGWGRMGYSCEKETDSPSLNDLGQQVLERLETGPQTIRELSVAVQVNAATMGVIVNRLDQLGCLQDGGIRQRKVALSEKGRTVLDECRHGLFLSSKHA